MSVETVRTEFFSRIEVKTANRILSSELNLVSRLLSFDLEVQWKSFGTRPKLYSDTIYNFSQSIILNIFASLQ